MDKCRFCNIDSKQTKIIKQGKYIYVCLSNPRLVDGHLLVIPKRHIRKLSELKDEERNELFQTVIHYQDKILTSFASGCDIRQNCRPFQKESDVKVDHLHIHLQPRELFDELYQKCQKYETDIFKMLGNKEIDKFIRLFQEK